MKIIFRFRQVLICFLLFLYVNTVVFSEKLPQVKNIILCIADGWGENQILAAEFYHGRKAVYKDFPVQLFMSHYPAKLSDTINDITKWNTGYNSYYAWNDPLWLNRNVTGSASSGTAIATGKKTYNNSIGLDINHNKIKNITERAAEIGKYAGVVTSVPFSHATPACMAAHNKNRNNYEEIARDMLLDSKLSVIMGAGHPLYDSDGNLLKDENADMVFGDENYKYVGGKATWDMLTNKAIKCNTSNNQGTHSVQDIDDDGQPDPWILIQDRKEFQELTKGETPKRVIGIPKVAYTLQQSRKSNNQNGQNEAAYTVAFIENIPTLEGMALGALNVLDNDPEGFFLMIEGGAIDWACHDNQPGRLIEEQSDFDDAVKGVCDWVEENSNWDETLLIVTGDHETGFLTGTKDTIAFGNDLSGYRIKDRGKGNMPEMYFHSDNHTNQLIPFYAKGSGSGLFNLIADEYDYHRGPYITNSEIGIVMFLLWRR
jgi:alkaline phosphatase